MDDVTLVVGDCHIGAGQNFRRFDWLGKLIEHKKPTRVVFIGDVMTMDSLSAWDRDKRQKMEGRRYNKDIDCGLKAFDKMFAQIGKKTVQNIEWVYIKGNHENRLDRYLEIDPTFAGHVDIITDLGLDELMEVVEYKDDYIHKGVAFTHIPITEGGTCLAAGGHASSAKKALDLYSSSVVYGHTHKLETACKHRHGAKRLQQALNVGCFFEHVDEYALGSVTSYWRGLVLMTHYDVGRFDIETISLGRMKREYG